MISYWSGKKEDANIQTVKTQSKGLFLSLGKITIE
jgi:hypothetical protein